MNLIRRFLVFFRFLAFSPISQKQIRKMYAEIVALDLDEPVELPIGKLNACGLTVLLIGKSGFGFAIHEMLGENKRPYLYAQELQELPNGVTTGDRVYVQGKYVTSFVWVSILMELHSYIRLNPKEFVVQREKLPFFPLDGRF